MTFEWISQPESWIALLTLTWLEIVLGIDNVIFISVLVAKLPPHQRNKGRVIGLSLAMLTRIALLCSMFWLIRLTQPLFTVLGIGFSGRDLVLILGGLFLIAKSTKEINESLEGPDDPQSPVYGGINKFWAVMIQIAILDIVFSLDSVITAVGLANQLEIMVLAIVISIFVMMFAAKTIGHYVEKHPSLKMLALSFLILVGVTLLGEGFEFNIPKGYIYFAMAFSFGVEMLNIRLRGKRTKEVKLKKVI